MTQSKLLKCGNLEMHKMKFCFYYIFDRYYILMNILLNIDQNEITNVTLIMWYGIINLNLIVKVNKRQLIH